MLKKRKFWKRLIIGVVATPVLLMAIAIALVYWKQDEAVEYLLETFNEDFVGELEIRDSHISPFSNFPHITVDLEGLKIWEGKDKHDISPIVEVEDAYVGFNFWTILRGELDIDFIRVENGELDLIMHEDGSLNVSNALSSPKDIKVKDVAEEFHLHLKAVEVQNLDVHKYNESTHLDVEAYINEAKASFETAPEHVKIELESKFLMNVIDNGDTTVVRHKHFFIDTHLDFDQTSQLLTIEPSKMELEHGNFKIDGSLDVKDSLNIDLNIHGNKPNFDLFIAFAPEELIPTLESYENAGDIFFEANVKGKAIDGLPAVNVDFGCEQAFFKNPRTDKEVREMNFKGHFSNTLTEAHDLSAMEFSIQNFHAVPEAGFFDGDVVVKNFESPEIDMNLSSDFSLDFLAKFFNLRDLQDLSGKVLLNMKFHDIIDLANPEKSIEKLNEAYDSELIIKDLSFKAGSDLPAIESVNAKVHMDGHKAEIDYVDAVIGNSDIHLDGSVSDLPAILHHTDDLIDCRLNISSKLLDIQELTAGQGEAAGDSAGKKGIDEQISNLRMKLDFKSSARAFTESKHLPEGEFFIEDLYAKLQHYPHTFHDFHADIFVKDNDLSIVDFSGMIDKSDFHFHGKLHDYAFWLSDTLNGDTRIDYDLTCDHLRLEDLFAYRGENHVPEDYRHEVLDELKVHGIVFLHFRDHFQSADMRLTQVDAKMKIHPLKFRNFSGRIHYEDEHVQIDTLFGQIGRSSFNMDLNYYIGDDESIRKRDNHLGLHASRLDLDELMNYNPLPGSENEPVDHEAGFNIYDLPFSPMTFDVDVKNLNYHKYLISNLVTRFRTERDHHIRIDQLDLDAAGGHWNITGAFDGRDRNKIFLDPTIKLTGIDLDKLLFKFDNFGQDEVAAENLHGKLSGTITGHIHVHPDFVPKIDDSEIHMDIEVLNGRLENYAPITALSEYFGDKNLASVKFDSLRNHLDLTNGVLNIPNMTLNTTLGHMDFSGSQKASGDYDMEYYVRVPFKMVTGVAKQKLFGKKDKKEADVAADEAAEEDEIIYKDETKRTRYLNIKIVGNLDDYKIGLGKDKRNKKKKKRKG